MKKLSFICLLFVLFVDPNNNKKLANAYSPQERACFDNCKNQSKCHMMEGADLKACRQKCAQKCDD